MNEVRKSIVDKISQMAMTKKRVIFTKEEQDSLYKDIIETKRNAR